MRGESSFAFSVGLEWPRPPTSANSAKSLYSSVIIGHSVMAGKRCLCMHPLMSAADAWCPSWSAAWSSLNNEVMCESEKFSMRLKCGDGVETHQLSVHCCELLLAVLPYEALHFHANLLPDDGVVRGGSFKPAPPFYQKGPLLWCTMHMTDPCSRCSF